MSENQVQFRTATFGGFQKQDVLNFVEQTAKEHAEEVAALQKELEEARAAGEESSQRAISLAGRAEDLEAENTRLAAALAQREEELAAAVSQGETLAAQVKELQAKLAKAAPLAEAYEAVKDRTAGVELEAHGRAQAIERQAKERAKKAQEQLGEWEAKVEETYGRVCAELQATLTRAAGELQKVGGSLTAIDKDFVAHGEALKALRHQVESLTGPKVPEPLPVEPKKD